MLLARDGLLRGLRALYEEVERARIRADVFVVGGAAMATAYDTRRSTSDVNAVFVPTVEVRAAARRVAERLDLDVDWLNDGAKAFVPGDDPNESNVFEGKYLQVAAASPRFLLAMRLLASRVKRDRGDIRELYRLCGFTTAEEGLQVVAAAYPSRITPPRTRFTARGDVSHNRASEDRSRRARPWNGTMTPAAFCAEVRRLRSYG